MSIESDNTFQYKSIYIILMSVMSRGWSSPKTMSSRGDFSSNEIFPLPGKRHRPPGAELCGGERRGEGDVTNWFIPSLFPASCWWRLERPERHMSHVRGSVSQSVSQSVSVPFFLCRDTQLSLVTCNSLYIKFNFSPKLSRTCDVNHS